MLFSHFIIFDSDAFDFLFVMCHVIINLENLTLTCVDVSCRHPVLVSSPLDM